MATKTHIYDSTINTLMVKNEMKSLENHVDIVCGSAWKQNPGILGIMIKAKIACKAYIECLNQDESDEGELIDKHKKWRQCKEQSIEIISRFGLSMMKLF